jgi:hypothetical protein
MEEGESSKEYNEDGKYSKNGKEVRVGMPTRAPGRARNTGGGRRYHLRGGVGGRQRGGGGGGIPCQLETRSNNLHHTMMRQQTCTRTLGQPQ